MSEIRVYSSFDDLPPAFLPLFEQAGRQDGLFSSLPWFRNLAATAGDSLQQLRLYGVWSAGAAPRPLLLLPLCHDGPSRRGRVLRACANFYTSLYGPLGAGPDSRPGMESLLQAIAAESPRWDVIDLRPMAPDSPGFAAAGPALRQAGMAVQSYFCFGNWYLDVGGRSYRDYFDALPGRLRNTIRRKSRQLEQSGRARIEILSAAEDAGRASAAFEQVYRASWKEAEAYPAFIAGLIRSCAEQGWLRLGLVHLDGQPVAAQLWIVCHGVASIYKLAYDERHASWSAGTVLTAHLMRHALDVDRVREVDFLSGDDAYKRDWMSHRRERCGLMAFNLRTPRGWLAAARHLGPARLKNGWRYLRSRLAPA